MNYFLKYRFAIWTIVILSVIILSSVGTVLFLRLTHKPEKTKDRNSKRWEQIGQFFQKELNFTKEQEMTLKVYRHELFHNKKIIFDSLEKKRILLIKEISKPQPDSQILYRIAYEMGELHGKLQRATISNLLQIRSLCTPEQIKKLNTINDELIAPQRPRHRMGPPTGFNPAPIKTH